MSAPKMTYREAVKESWKKEMQIKDPRRILRLAYWTVYLSVYRVFVVLIPSAMMWLIRKVKSPR